MVKKTSNAIKRTPGEWAFDIINTIILILIIVVTLYPFVYVLFASISNPSMIASHTGLLLWPIGFDLSSYKAVLENPNILMGYKNTIFYVLVGTSVSLLMTILTAYVLSRKGYMLKRFLTFMAVFTMFFSGGLIPFYLQVNRLGLADTRWALIFPAAMSTYNVIVMRTAFSSIPDSLEESARIDGAQDFTILFHIVLPLSLPTVAIMVLFYGVGQWNSWFNAMVFLRNRNLYPLQLILREILILSDTSDMVTNMVVDREMIGETIKYATIIITTVPILLVYPFLQKYFVKGMMIGAVKE
ncbi:MAG: carbohydrate ABC transporter permease [Firmicutes bacterium]|nr:carbohydrate ABC transporter permease [Bacillota bacterium]